MERQRRRHFRGPYQGWLLVLGRSGSHPSKWLALLEGSWPLDSWGTLCFSLERIHRGVIKAQVLFLAVLYVSVNTKHTPSQWRGCGLVVLVCSVWVMWSRSHPKIGQYELWTRSVGKRPAGWPPGDRDSEWIHMYIYIQTWAFLCNEPRCNSLPSSFEGLCVGTGVSTPPPPPPFPCSCCLPLFTTH